MAHIQHGCAGLLVKLAQEFQDVCLRRYVQPGGRFVQQQCIRLTGQRHGNGYALLLPARKFVRVTPQNDIRLRQAHLREQFRYTSLMVCRGQTAV